LPQISATLDLAHELFKKLHLLPLGARLLRRVHIPVLSSESEWVDARLLKVQDPELGVLALRLSQRELLTRRELADQTWWRLLTLKN